MPNQRPRDGTDGGPAYPIESVDKALRLLTYLRDHPSVTVSAASAELGVARSTAHRLLAMLQHHGFVRQAPGSKAYVAGRALLEIGLAAVGNLDLRNIAHAEVERLALEVRETVHLIVLDGRSTLVIDSVESPEALRVSSRTGGSMPPHATSAGKVLLAELPSDEVRQLVGPEPLERLTPNTITTFAGLEEDLQRVREQGYATNLGENEPGIVSLAVRIPLPGERPAALAIAAPATRMPDDRVPSAVRAARAAAERIAARLDGRPPRAGARPAPAADDGLVGDGLR